MKTETQDRQTEIRGINHVRYIMASELAALAALICCTLARFAGEINRRKVMAKTCEDVTGRLIGVMTYRVDGGSVIPVRLIRGTDEAIASMASHLATRGKTVTMRIDVSRVALLTWLAGRGWLVDGISESGKVALRFIPGQWRRIEDEPAIDFGT